jgi:oligo-1,6-glucosidase
MDTQHKCQPNWWRHAVIYQVYPRSFKDSNADGVGDLPGILSQLDYIASLGIDTLWINPVFTSPGKDNGYDISDYRSVQPEYGSMADLELLIKKAHEKNIRLIIDMVFNHTSDQHEWFRQARTSRDNPYYDFYHWWAAEKGKPPFRCGFFDSTGEAWHFNKPTDSYYLHYFSPEQPDLNWDNPRLRQQLYAILRFYIEKGVDGFRFDAITFIAKDTTWPEITPAILKEKYRNDWGHYYAAGPRLHEYLKEMRREFPNTLFLGEAPGIPAGQALEFAGELDLITHFDGMTIGYLPGEFKKPDPAGYSREQFKKVYTEWSEVFNEKGWGTIYLGNHDQPRMVSRWGDDSAASAKALLTFLLTMRSTPFIYNGDELGMRNIRFTGIDDYRDLETHHIYNQLKAKGGDTNAFLRDQQFAGRDNGRTPFQWTQGANAGFTTGTPWLTINPDHQTVNREKEEKDPNSVLNYTRSLIKLRKQYPALTDGDFSLINHDDTPIFGYTRSVKGATLAIILNLSAKEISFDGLLSSPTNILINNYPTLQYTRQGLRLAPWQALVFNC